MSLKYGETDYMDCMKIRNLVTVKCKRKIGMHMEHFVWLNFLDVFSLCLVKVKWHEYQNLQDFLFPCKNSTICGYIQSTLSISLKIGHVEIKSHYDCVLNYLGVGLENTTMEENPIKQGWRHYPLFFSKHHSNSLDGNLILWDVCTVQICLWCELSI